MKKHELSDIEHCYLSFCDREEEAEMLLRAAASYEHKRDRHAIAARRAKHRQQFAYELIRRLGLMSIIDEAEKRGVIPTE